MEVKEDICSSLKKLGCCELCCLRFSGEKRRDAFRSALPEPEVKEEAERPVKIVKSNPCITCIGLLQSGYVDSVIKMAADQVAEAGYDSCDFSIAISLPTSFQLRAHSMQLYMAEHFPDSKESPDESWFASVKDVWKWIAAPKIAKLIDKRYDAQGKSPFSIEVRVAYQGDQEERATLKTLYPKEFKVRKTRTDSPDYSRKSLEQLLSTTENTHFKRHYPCPPSIPNVTATCDSVELIHSSVFVAGRYRKLRRDLSQTPWFFNGERQMESSVQELLCDRIVKLARAEDMRFSSSGREDVDVRMLGRGRPFVCELVNPRHVAITAEEFRAIEKDILSEKFGVEASLLQIVSKDELNILKEGEEEKAKVYIMYCVLPKGGRPDFDALKELCTMFPVTLQQRTPVRVLHRRPLATRPRTLHWMEVKESTTADPRTFILRVATQAGTYVKEFVHGDLGRTVPNLAMMLGAEVDILALDVEDILLDWPPEINSTNESAGKEITKSEPQNANSTNTANGSNGSVNVKSETKEVKSADTTDGRTEVKQEEQTATGSAILSGS